LHADGEAGPRGYSSRPGTSGDVISSPVRGSLNSNVFTAACSGAVSGVAVAIVGHPFDTLKVRLQTSTSQLISDGMRLSRQHGPLGGLFRGLPPQIATQLVTSATLFGLEDHIHRGLLYGLNRTVGNKEGEGYAWKLLPHCVAGAIAGGALSIVTCPLEVIKCRLQVAGAPPMGPRFLHSSLPTSLWRGMHATILRCSLGNFAFFGIFHASKEAYGRELSPWETVCAGAVAGCGYWTVGYPFDLIKSQQQCSVGDALCGTRPLPTLSELAKQNVRERGLSNGLFRGLGITLARAVPTSGVAWLTYCTMHKWLQ